MHSTGRGGAGNIHAGTTSVKPETLGEEERRKHAHHEAMSVPPHSPCSHIPKTDTHTVTRPAEVALQTSPLPTSPTSSASRTIMGNSSQLDVGERATFVLALHLVTRASGPFQRRNTASPRFSTSCPINTSTSALMINLVHPRTKALLMLPINDPSQDG